MKMTQILAFMSDTDKKSYRTLYDSDQRSSQKFSGVAASLSHGWPFFIFWQNVKKRQPWTSYEADSYNS